MTDDLLPQIIAERGRLMSFAMSFTRNKEDAEDLVQDTVLRAVENVEKFEPDTNLQAWLFTILRNLHHGQWRKRRRVVEDPDGKISGSVSVPADQAFGIQLEEAMRAINALPPDRRDAFRLTVMEDYSYEDAADILGCSVGTLKSRVNRARAELERGGIFASGAVDKSGDIQRLLRCGKSASEIAAMTGESLVDVMKAISTLGKRRRG